MVKGSKTLFAAIFNKKFLLFVSQCQCFVFVYFLGWQVQSCKYVNVNNCQLSATSLSSVQPPTNTLNIKNKQTSNILLFQFYCLLLDKVGDFVRSWSGLRAAWRRISWRLWIILWHHFFITIAFLGHEALKKQPKAALQAARSGGRDRGARIQSGGYLLRCSQLFTSRLRRSARISYKIFESSFNRTAWESAHSSSHFFVTNGGSQLTLRT